MADPLVTGRVCIVDGCVRFVCAHGLCKMHYTRARRHGSTDHPQRWANAEDGTKWCPRCEAYITVGMFGSSRNKKDGLASYCRPCGAAYRRSRREASPQPARPKTVSRCDICLRDFNADKRNRLFCSPDCRKIGKIRYGNHYRRSVERSAAANKKWRERYPERNRKKAQEYRARKQGALVERFSEQEIFERDQWECGICHAPIDQDLRSPHPLSRSIDHRVPLARGGQHSRANCQAAHLVCNTRKGDRLALPSGGEDDR